MSRRKAGRTPRRVDPAPVANSDSETEMRDLVIDVNPESNPWLLQAPGLRPSSSKEVPAPGRLEGEPRYSPDRVRAGGPLHALVSRNQCVSWSPVKPNPRGERPLYRAPLLSSPFTLEGGWAPPPGSAPRLLPPAPAIFSGPGPGPF